MKRINGKGAKTEVFPFSFFFFDTVSSLREADLNLNQDIGPAIATLGGPQSAQNFTQRALPRSVVLGIVAWPIITVMP